MLDFAIFAVTFLLALVGAVLYLYPASRQAAGIPGITPTEEKDGNLPDIVNSGSLHEFLVNLHERYGPVVSFWFGRRLVVSLGTVDVLKQHINPNKTLDPFETMLKSLLRYQSDSGNVSENHMRKKLYENGVTNCLRSNFALLLKLSEELLDKWLSYPESQHVPLCQHMLGFAMKSVTRMVMGSTFEDEQEVIRFQKNHGTVWSEIGKGFLDGSLDKSTTRKKQYEDALMQLESILKKIIKERKGRNFSQHIFIDSLVQGSLNDQQILEDTMIFSLASCVITAKLCTWAICFLTTYEEIQKKLYEEIDQVLGKGPITQRKLRSSGIVGKPDFQGLRDALDSEHTRRKHCERHIQNLQTRVLELQQQLAVAVTADRKKDIMIEQLDKTLARVVEGWNRHEAERTEVLRGLQEERQAAELTRSKQQETVTRLEQSLSEAMEALSREQEGARLQQREKETLEEERQALTLSLELEQQRCQVLQEERDEARAGQLSERRQLETLQDLRSFW